MLTKISWRFERKLRMVTFEAITMTKTSDKSSLLLNLDLIVWTLAFIVTLPLALFLCIPLVIYRKFVEISAKIYQPDLVRIVPPIQQILFHNDFHEDRVSFNILTWQTLKGTLKLQDLRKIIQENLINQFGSNGELEFPEFQQYFSFYGGCVFFKWDRTFNVANHVRYLDEAQDGSITTESDLQKIISRLMSKGWPQSRSAWEILVINNYRSDDGDTNSKKSILIFRFHHSLADGYSYLNFMVRRLCQGDNPVSAISPTRKFTTWEKIYMYVWSTLRQPYDFVKLFKSLNGEVSHWNPPYGTLSKKYTVVWSKPVSVDTIKKIKSRHGVSFQSVLHSIIGGTVQSLMMRAGQKVPQIMNGFGPFPLANHPGGLCIHTHFSIVKIPIAGKDPVRRLLTAHKFWMEEIHSTARWMIHKVVRTIGWLPWTVGDKVVHNIFTNIGLSCFPGIEGDIFLDKQKVLEVNFAVGTDKGTSAATFTTLSCFGFLRFVIIIDKTVYPYEDVGQYFNEYVEKELQSLRDSKENSDVIAAPSG